MVLLFFGISPFWYRTFNPGNFFLFIRKKITHIYTHHPKMLAFNLKPVFFHTFFLIYLGTFPVIQFVSDSKGADARVGF